MKSWKNEARVLGSMEGTIDVSEGRGSEAHTLSRFGAQATGVRWIERDAPPRGGLPRLRLGPRSSRAEGCAQEPASVLFFAVRLSISARMRR